MNVQNILDFYARNGLYESKHAYVEKFNSLQWFCQFDSIGIQHVYDYCDLRRSQGVKNSTINREITVIRSAFSYYLKHQNANFKNVFLGFDLFEEDYLPRYLSESECLTFLRCAREYSQVFHDFILLLLNTGCRRGELLSLRWENVFLDDRYFVIRNSLSKNKKTIYKPLTNDSIEALKRLNNSSPYVFFNDKTGKPYTGFRRALLTCIERSEVKPFRIHDLRHTFASFLVKKGIPIYHVSTLLGHSDTRITQKYAHLAPRYLHSCMDSLPSFEGVL